MGQPWMTPVTIHMFFQPVADWDVVKHYTQITCQKKLKPPATSPSSIVIHHPHPSTFFGRFNKQLQRLSKDPDCVPIPPSKCHHHQASLWDPGHPVGISSELWSTAPLSSPQNGPRPYRCPCGSACTCGLNGTAITLWRAMSWWKVIDHLQRLHGTILENLGKSKAILWNPNILDSEAFCSSDLPSLAWPHFLEGTQIQIHRCHQGARRPFCQAANSWSPGLQWHRDHQEPQLSTGRRMRKPGGRAHANHRRWWYPTAPLRLNLPGSALGDLPNGSKWMSHVVDRKVGYQSTNKPSQNRGDPIILRLGDHPIQIWKSPLSAHFRRKPGLGGP